MTDDISKVVLKPCPFCGGRAERIDFGPGSGDNEGGSCISCTVCQSSGPVEYGRKENFVSTWNRRLESATTPAEVDDGHGAFYNLRELTECRCHEDYKSRGRIDPDCNHLYREDVDTLARQLAEANKRADRAELTLGQYAETAAELGAQRNEARAQLAAATRRVAEVECLLQALLDYAEHGDITQMGRSFSEIKAAARTALTKEPTK